MEPYIPRIVPAVILERFFCLRATLRLILESCITQLEFSVESGARGTKLTP